MSDFQKILVIICFNIATVVYVKLFKHRIKEGFNLTVHPFKGMDKLRKEEGHAIVGTIKGVASFLFFWLAVKLVLYSGFFNLYTTYRWISGQSLFGP